MINKAVAVNPKILTSIKKIFLFFEYCFSSYLKNNIFSQCGISFFSHIFLVRKKKNFHCLKRLFFVFLFQNFLKPLFIFFLFLRKKQIRRKFFSISFINTQKEIFEKLFMFWFVCPKHSKTNMLKHGYPVV